MLMEMVLQRWRRRERKRNDDALVLAVEMVRVAKTSYMYMSTDSMRTRTLKVCLWSHKLVTLILSKVALIKSI